MDIRPGSAVYGSDGEVYDVKELIGRGAFGDVFRIKQQGVNVTRALKTISTPLLNSNELAALQNEGRLALGLDHPNVLKMRYFHDGHEHVALPPYVIMDYADGGSLQRLLNGQRDSKVNFSSQELTGFFLQLARGMKAINEHLIHRDIKPDNVLIQDGILKISDFGLARIAGAATRTATFKGIQHIQYMPPEAWELKANTIQMDMYSMGIVFYELATLKHPYEANANSDHIVAWRNAHLYSRAEPPERVNQLLAGNLSGIILRMISKRPGDRPKTWDEIIERIEGPGDTVKTLDIGNLLRKAQVRQQEAESRRLEDERQRRDEEARRQLITSRFGEIQDAISSIVEAFNSQSDTPKFITSHDQIWRSQATLSGTPDLARERKFVYVDCQEARDMSFRGRSVAAWGVAKASTGQGFNLLLVRNEPEDLYGAWVTLHHQWSPFARRSSPHAFAMGRLEELRTRLSNINALDVYETREAAFTVDELVPLFESIL